MKAIILAGGKGSRFAPITDTIPKALLPIGDTTLIELIINSLPETIDTIIITTNYLGKKIQEKLGSTYKNRKIFYAAQSKEYNGTWPAFFSAKKYIDTNELFCVLGCDDLFDTQEIQKIIEKNTIGMGITKTILPAKYHKIVISPENIIESFQRHPEENREELLLDDFANGFFILDRRVFDFTPIVLIDGEYGLPQTLLANKNTYPLYAHHMNIWTPCNTFSDLEKIKSLMLI